MNSTTWVVLGGVAALALYLYYKGKVEAAKIEAAAHPANALNTLASKSSEIIDSLGMAFSGSYV
jgi:hypothetical protein